MTKTDLAQWLCIGGIWIFVIFVSVMLIDKKIMSELLKKSLWFLGWVQTFDDLLDSGKIDEEGYIDLLLILHLKTEGKI